MSVLDRLRKEASPVARRRRVSAARSWVTYSPKRAKTVGLVVALVLAVGIFGGVAKTSMFVQQVTYDAQMGKYKQSLVAPTDSGTLTLQPLVPNPEATTPPAPPTADATAEALARKWVQTWLGGPSAASQAVWAQRLRPMLLPSLFPSYAAANRSLIPKATITSVTSVMKGNKAYATVTLSNGVVTLVVMEGAPGRWLVDEFTDIAAD